MASLESIEMSKLDSEQQEWLTILTSGAQLYTETQKRSVFFFAEDTKMINI